MSGLLNSAVSFSLGAPMKCLVDEDGDGESVSFISTFADYVSKVGSSDQDEEVNKRIEENVLLQSEREGEGEELVCIVFYAMRAAICDLSNGMKPHEGWRDVIGIASALVHKVVDNLSFKVAGMGPDEVARRVLCTEDEAVAAHAIEIAKFEPSSSEHFTIVGCSSSCSLVLPGLVIPLFGSNVTRWPGGSARGRWATVDSKAVLRLASSGYNVILDAVKDWGCDFVAVEGGRLTGNTKEEKDFLAVCQRCIVRVLDGLTRREAEGICEMYGIRGGVGERGSEEGEVEAICFEGASEAHKERFVGGTEEGVTVGQCKFLHLKGSTGRRGEGRSAVITCGRTGAIVRWHGERAKRAARAVKRVGEGGTVMRRGAMEAFVVHELDRLEGDGEGRGLVAVKKAIEEVGILMVGGEEEWGRLKREVGAACDDVGVGGAMASAREWRAGNAWVNAEATRRAWERGFGMLW